MPFSKARRRRRTDLSSSTSPHQPVLTVQTPKPTSDTRMSVSPRLRYFIYAVSSYLELVYGESFHILPASAVSVWQVAHASSSSVRTGNHHRPRFWATVREEPEVEVALV